MFDKYYLVELSACNSVKSVRSNCVLKSPWHQRFPDISLPIKNCADLGYTTVNILSVTRISKKTANYIAEYINSPSTIVDPGRTESSVTAKDVINAMNNAASGLNADGE